jgi:hypothetical protein
MARRILFDVCDALYSVTPVKVCIIEQKCVIGLVRITHSVIYMTMIVGLPVEEIH